MRDGEAAHGVGKSEKGNDLANSSYWHGFHCLLQSDSLSQFAISVKSILLGFIVDPDGNSCKLDETIFAQGLMWCKKLAYYPSSTIVEIVRCFNLSSSLTDTNLKLDFLHGVVSQVHSFEAQNSFSSILSQARWVALLPRYGY